MSPLLLSLNLAKMRFKSEPKSLQAEILNKVKGVHWMNAKAKPDQAYVPTTIEHIANVMTHVIRLKDLMLSWRIDEVKSSRVSSQVNMLSTDVSAPSSRRPLKMTLEEGTETSVDNIFTWLETRELLTSVWVAPSVYACMTLVQRSASWPQYWSALIYGAALILLFTISTFFHSVFFCSRDRSGKMGQLKEFLHRGDRAMIYVFIAASYFPWLTLRPLPPDGWAAELRWVVWVLASLGILYQQLFHEQYKWLETLFYLVMGIAPSIAILSMSDFSGLTELKIGGLIYVLGVVFFKADGCIPCAHAIWHLHVVLAAGVHYYAILKYLYM